jgi:hypothetical protein
VQALNSVWNELGIKRTSDWRAQGGFVGVGVEGAEARNAPIWEDHQLGLVEGESLEVAADRELSTSATEKQKVVPRMQTGAPAQPAAVASATVGVAA